MVDARPSLFKFIWLLAFGFFSGATFGCLKCHGAVAQRDRAAYELNSPSSEDVAPVDLKNKLFKFGCIRDFSHGMKATAIQPIGEEALFTQKDVARYIPSNMQPTSNSGRIAAQILDRTVSSVMQSSAVQKSDFGQTAKMVDKAMSTNMDFGGADPDSTRHSVKFTVRASDTQARLEYTGFTTAQLTYSVAQETTNFEVREPLPGLSTQLVLNSIATRFEHRQIASLSWKW